MRLMVTGGSGYIGTHLTEGLLASGHQVVSVDREPPSITGREGFTFVRRDLLGDLTDIMDGCEAVIHLAANPFVSDSANRRDTYGTTASVIGSMRESGLERLIFVSSSAVYGCGIPPFDEDSPCSPVSEYGRAKADSEDLVREFLAQPCILRFCNVSGGAVRHGVAHDFFMKLRRDPDELRILGNGNQTREYMHVDDAVSSIEFALENGISGTFNVSNSDPISVLDVARVTMDTMGLTETSVLTEDREIGWTGDIPSMILNPERYMSLGWRPRKTSTETIRDSISSLMCRRPV